MKVIQNNYLKNPVPHLSENNVEFICEKMKSAQYDYFIEYGLGASTLYFSDKFADDDLTIVSIENSINWFEAVVKVFKDKEDLQEIYHRISRFKISEIYRFANKLSVANSLVPPQLSRLKRWRESLLLGRFIVFSPFSNSHLSGKIVPWFIFKWPFIIINFFLYVIFPGLRPARGEFAAKRKKSAIICRNVPPRLKDQFGESPSAKEYIEAGLKELREDLKKSHGPIRAAFLIDGGPRAEILRTILKMEDECPNFYPSVFLCEAHRVFYGEVMKLRPTGVFLAGCNLTMNGEVVQPGPRKLNKEAMSYWFGKESVTKEELAQKEVWFYQKELVSPFVLK